MEAVVYSNFRNNLKDYMKKVNDEFEPLLVVNKSKEEDVVVLSKAHWDSLQETIRLLNNPELAQKITKGLSQVQKGQTVGHKLLGDDYV